MSSRPEDTARAFHELKRSGVASSHDRFLIHHKSSSSTNFHISSSDPAATCSPITRDRISTIIHRVELPGRVEHHGPAERECAKLFKAQRANRPSTFTGSDDIVPGTAHLIDHLAAATRDHHDWATLIPSISYMQNHRIANDLEQFDLREVTIGESSNALWEHELLWFRKKMKETRELCGLNVLAADVEKTQVIVRKGESLADVLWQFEINMHEKSVSLPLERSGHPCCAVPVRLMIGGHDWQLNIRIPVVEQRDNLLFILNTPIPPALIKLLEDLPPLVGVNITEDVVEFGRVVHSIWSHSQLQAAYQANMRPVELDVVMRLVGINTKSYSMFHQNLWCLGTVLPKHHGSRGDRKWHRELEHIPDALKLYLANDTSQPFLVFWIYNIIFAMNRFPDTLAVAHLTHGVSPRGLVTWICDKVIIPLSSNSRKITSSNSDIWLSCEHPPQIGRAHV